MGWFDGASTVSLGGKSNHGSATGSRHAGSKKHKEHREHKERRPKPTRSTTGSTFGDWVTGNYKPGKSSRRSSPGRATSRIEVVEPRRSYEYPSHKNKSTASFFSVGSSHASTSAYGRSPRKGFMARMYKKLKHLLKKLKKYMKSHPLKVFMLVIMPLITGGVLTSMLARFGIRLPHTLEKLIAKIAGKPSYADVIGVGMSAMGTSVGRGRDGREQFERKRSGGPLDSIGGYSGAIDGVGGLLSVAKLFI